MLTSFICCGLLFGLLASATLAASSENKGPQAQAEPAGIEAKWGVEIMSIRLTAAGKMLDYRFRIIDPEKAMSIMRRGDKAYLIDQATGTRMPIPRTKVGPLRQTGSKPKQGSVYPILFMNLGQVVKPGSKVTVVLGDFRVENLVVEGVTPHQATLPQAKQAQWEGAQKSLRNELDSCNEDCGQDQNCFDKCEKAYKSRLDTEYQKLLYEK